MMIEAIKLINKQQLIWLCLCGLTSISPVIAQSTDQEQGLPLDPVVYRLDELTKRLAKYMKEVSTFGVETTTHWNLDGLESRSGVTRCRLVAQQNQAFMLEVTGDSKPASTLLCASDGRSLTRQYQSDHLTIISRHAGGLDQVLDDGLTDGSLKGTGLNVILRRDVHDFLMSSVSGVKDCGLEQVQGKSAVHFSAVWSDGSPVDFWIASDNAPVLLRWKRVIKVDLGNQPHELRMDSQLKWDLNPTVTDDLMVIQPSSQAIEVNDLQSYLLKGGTGSLLGQTAPSVPVKLLDGTDWDLNKHRSQQVAILYFNATWAVPATQEIPAFLKFIDEYDSHDVVFYLVNVGESSDTVRAFIEAEKYEHPVVLDPEQSAAAAYRVTSLPVTVLIGKDGTLQAAHVGSSPETNALIRSELQQLIQGDPLRPAVAALTPEPSVDAFDSEPYTPKQEVSGQVRLVGSATMQQLAALWSDGFQRLHPEAEVNIDCRGSETALPALTEDQVVLGLMSRPLTDEEQKKLEQESTCRIVSLKVCTDRLGVISHSSNPISGLNLDLESGQLRAETEVTKARTWGELGVAGDWAEVPISRHSLQSDSGTRWHFDRMLKSSQEGSASLQEHVSQADLVKSVAEDRGGLALVSLPRGQLANVRVLPISTDGRNFIYAADDQASTSRYPLMRALYLVVAVSGESLDRPIVEEFLAYVLSEAGQQDVIKDGFLPLDLSELHAEQAKLGWKRIE